MMCLCVWVKSWYLQNLSPSVHLASYVTKLTASYHRSRQAEYDGKLAQ